MAKGLHVDYDRLSQINAEYFWNKLNKKEFSEGELEAISQEISKDNDEKEFKSNIHDAAGVLFSGDKEINNDYHATGKNKEMFILSATAVQRMIDTVDVYNNGMSLSYAKFYKFPKVTEKNKDAILMHFMSNITAGPASKGYLDKSYSLQRFAIDPNRDAEFIIPNVPGVDEAKKKIEKAKTAVKPSISIGNRFLGFIQKKLGMDRPARRAYDEYHQKLNEYNVLKNVENEKKLISTFDSVTEQKKNYSYAGYAETKAEKDRIRERDLKYKEEVQKQLDAGALWNQKFYDISMNISCLKSSKMKEGFEDHTRQQLDEMKKLIPQMSNKDEAQKKYDALEDDYKSALKTQKGLRNQVTKINDNNLSQKMGMEQKHNSINKSHVQKNKEESLKKSFG